MKHSVPGRVRSLILAAVFAPLASLAQAAPPPGTTLLPPIDLSPGVDVPNPTALSLNRSTNKLYVLGSVGFDRTLTATSGVKVINSATGTVIGGLTLGKYPNNAPFRGMISAVDESAGADGNKLYVVGHAADLWVLRVVDGATDTNLTGPGTDVILPVPLYEDWISESPGSIVVNPANHKVYIATTAGQIIVVDGPKRQVLKTLNPGAGSFLTLDPVANKVFVLGENGGAIIDSATDTVSAPPEPLVFIPTGAVFNRENRLTYLAGSEQESSNFGVYVLDGSSGSLVGSRTTRDGYFPPDRVTGLALAPGETTLYLGSYRILPFDIETLTIGESMPHRGWNLALDPANAGVLYTIPERESDLYHAKNTVNVIDRSTTEATTLATLATPGELAVNPRTNRIYVLDSRVPQILVVDGKDHRVVAHLHLPSGQPAAAIAVSERLNRIYVPGYVFDGATNELIGSLTMPLAGVSPIAGKALVVDDTRRRVYRARSEGGRVSDWELGVFDSDSGNPLSSLYIGRDGEVRKGAVAVNPVTGRIYYSSGATGWPGSDTTRFTVIDGASLEPLMTRFDFNGSPASIAVNRKTNKVFVPQNDGSIGVLDGATDQFVAPFPAGGDSKGITQFTGVAVDEEDDTVSVRDTAWNGQKNVSRVLTYRGQDDHALLDEVEIGEPGSGLYFNPASRQLLAPSSDGTIVVLQKPGSPAAANQFGNLSTRLRVGGNDDVMISGVIVNAPAGTTKKVIVRAVGPSLEPLGVLGALADTTLELHTAAGQVITNDNWKISDVTRALQQAEIEATGLAPSDDREAAIIAELPPGHHTAVIRGKDGSVGVGLAEVFSLESDSPAQFANIATRGRVGIGEDVMIAGVIVKGPTASRVLGARLGHRWTDSSRERCRIPCSSCATSMAA